MNRKAQQIHQANKEKGFWEEWYNALNYSYTYTNFDACESLQRTFISEKIALIHSELSELLEARRKPAKPDEHCPNFSNAEIELADIQIRLLDIAPAITSRFGEAIEAKLAFNATRPHKHGKNS